MNFEKTEKSITLILIIMICGILLSPITQALGSEVVEYHMCSEVDTKTRLPKGKGPVFFTHSVKAYLWVKVTDMTPGQIIRFEWFDPGGFFDTSSITVESAEIEEYWESITIEGGLPGQLPGTWTVKLYIDDKLIVTEKFDIVNYFALIQEIQNLIDNVNELRNTVSQYTTDIELLQDDYSDMITEYDEIKDSYEALQSDYDTLQRNYDDLLEDYNSIQTDESILKKFRTTRNIMYGTIAAVIVLFIITIYLARKK